MDDQMVVQWPSKNYKCKTCRLASIFRLDICCCAYKMKPYEILFEGKDCPYYKKQEVLEDDVEDDEDL